MLRHTLLYMHMEHNVLELLVISFSSPLVGHQSEGLCPSNLLNDPEPFLLLLARGQAIQTIHIHFEIQALSCRKAVYPKPHRTPSAHPRSPRTGRGWHWIPL